MAPGRPKKNARLADELRFYEEDFDPVELDPEDEEQFIMDVLRARDDPIWFIEEILGFPGPDEHGNAREMWPVQRDILRGFYEHKYDSTKPKRKKMALVAGQRSSKTSLISCILAYELFEVISWENPARHFGLMVGKSGKGSTIALTCLATSRTQAGDGVFANMKSMIQGNPWFERHFPGLTFGSQRIEYPSKNVICQVLAAKASTAAGYTNKIVIFDEFDYFTDSETDIDAMSVYHKLCNSTETFGLEGKIVAISSLKSATGIMMDVFYEFEREEPLGLSRAYMYRTWEMNPTLSEDYLRKSCGRDRARFLRDFANQPEISSGLQFPEGVVLNSDMANVLQLDFDNLPEDITMYPRVLAIDPAYKNDSFGVACAYRVGDQIIVDGVYKFQKMGDIDAYILPSDIKNFILKAVRSLNVVAFVHDIYMYPEILEAIQYEIGLDPIMHQVAKEDYDRWRELQEKLHPIDLQVVFDEDLKEECEQLFITQTPGGKPKVDHPKRRGCFVGETRIRLLDGSCPEIKDLVGKGDVWVYSCDGKTGDLVPGKGRARLTKYVNTLVDIVLDTGAVVRCTPDHPIMLRNGVYKEAKDIIPKVDRLMPCNVTEISKDGYYFYNHPFIRTKNRYQHTVHRFIAKSVYGNILDDEVVHHINEIKVDNRPENLQIVDKYTHTAYHSKIKHESDSEYSKKATGAMYKFNTSESGRKFRAEVGRRVFQNRTKEEFISATKNNPNYRSDITIQKLIESKSNGDKTAHAASKFLNCGRNVIVRVLREHGYSSWEEFVTESGSNHRVYSIEFITLDEPVPVYDLEVDKWNNFGLTAGIFVHNSKDTSDCVANCIWFLEAVDPEEFEEMTPAGIAVMCDASGKMVYGSIDDDEIDFYA